MTGVFRLGIAGANAERGWARDAHLPALKVLPGIAVHAVSARTQEIADVAARTFGAAKTYANSLAMACDPDIDIVAVTVKVPEHRDIVLAALDAGKHVYCEWPLARDLAEAHDLAEAARRAGTHVVIGLQGATARAVRLAAAIVRDGRIGRPLHLRVVSSTSGWGTVTPPHYAYLQDRRNGATLSTIAGGHTFAMVEAVIGAYLDVGARNSILYDTVAIAGTSERITRTCVDHMIVHGHHASGCVSNVEIVGNRNAPLRFELQGTMGALEIRGHHPGGYQCGKLEVSWSAAGDAHGSSGADGETSDLCDAAHNVAELYRNFESDIRKGLRTVPDFDVAVKLTRLLDAIETAGNEGRNVALVSGTVS